VKIIDSFNDREKVHHLIDLLAERIKQPLPGMAAQIKMTSNFRTRELRFSYDTSLATRSSVLILLFPHENSLKTIFILRQTYDGVHSGQVSFPGGRYEEHDGSRIVTALRESFEEVHIDPEKVKVLGTLSELYIPPSNYLVLPVLGFCESRPDFVADKTEVADLIEADIRFLFDEKLVKETIIEVRGNKIRAPYFDVQGHVVWGATAMILSELKEVIRSLEG
jgi:8-oxo-dGTP pyrophosphatase MutT (NUDIX family)